MGIFNFKKSHRNESNLDENLFLDDRNRDLWNSLKNCRDIKIPVVRDLYSRTILL